MKYGELVEDSSMATDNRFSESHINIREGKASLCFLLLTNSNTRVTS